MKKYSHPKVVKLISIVGLSLLLVNWLVNSGGDQNIEATSSTAEQSEESTRQENTGMTISKPTIPNSKDIIPTKTITDTLASSGTSYSCNGEEFELEEYLNNFAEQIEAQNILYNTEKLSDCSGMFLRLCSNLKKKCDDYIFPSSKAVRDTRRLAKWYAKKGRLTIIENAEASGYLIKPGAVMFYGHGGVTYNDLTIEKITANDGIEHVGTVTSVTKDKNGKVIQYSLFHGRSNGKPAGRTTYHQLKPYRTQLPAYGNWNQQWVAVADIMTPKKES